MQEQYKAGFAVESSGKDLFMEQIVVCQMLGVSECFDLKYVSLFMQWQDESGCWKEDREDDDLKQDTANNVIGFLEENRNTNSFIFRSVFNGI